MERPLALVNGRFATMDPKRTRAEAVVVEGDRIVAVGDRGLADHHDGPVRDLGGRLVLPGFIDAHNHLSIAALHPRWADLSGVTSEEEVVAALRAQAVAEPEAAWVRGVAWNEHASGVMVDRHLLDQVGVDRPVIVAHVTLHQCAVDSRGLDALGIGRTTPDPEAGTIVRDPAGDATGVLLEQAWSEAHARSLADYAHPDRWGELIAARSRALLTEGITCVHDAACSPEAEAVYRSLARRGDLPISVLSMPHPLAMLGRDWGPSGDRLDGPPTGDGDEWFRVGPLKLFADGGVVPAIEVDVDGHRVELGIRFPAVTDEVVRATERGWRVAVHAIGNVAVAAALEAFAAASRRRPDHDHRFRVEHLVLPSPQHLADMRALGAVASVQPAFVRDFGDALAAHPDLRPLMGEPWMPWAAVRDAGIPLAASSDDPCAPYGPIVSSVPGALRRTALGAQFGSDQAVGYEDWFEAYTLGAAYAGGQEAERGSLTPGKRADLVVLEGELDPDRPPRVAETWVAGSPVWQATPII